MTRREAAAARHRRQLLAAGLDDPAAWPTFRRRLWAHVRWLLAEAVAAPGREREQLLAGLRDLAGQMNTRRQEGRTR